MIRNARDFCFDGAYLSDYGFIICSFDAPNIDNVSVGSNITVNTVSSHSGRRFHRVSAKYDGALSAEFTICKDPDTNDDMYISNDEYRDIMRWLNRTEFKECYFVSTFDEDTCFYEATFNVEQVFYGANLVGLNLEMMTNRPFGYGQEYKQTLRFNSDLQELALVDFSDEVGFFYPDYEIQVINDGNLRLSNISTGKTLAIDNCVAGETITIKGDSKIVTTDNTEHALTLADDFNYEFLRIGNTIENRRNRFGTTLPVVVTVRYKPIIK